MNFNVIVNGNFIDTINIEDKDMINVIIDVEHNCLSDNFIIPFLEDLEKIATKHCVCYDLQIKKEDNTIININCCRG